MTVDGDGQTVILIQTAFAMESGAIVPCFGSGLSEQEEAASTSSSHAIAGLLKQGVIAGRRCGLLKTGMGPVAAQRVLTNALDRLEAPTLVLSIGFAGSLSNRLAVGDRCLIQKVIIDSQREPAVLHPAPDKLAASWKDAGRAASLVTVAQPVLSAADKAALAERTGAALCDMETHAVASVCAARGVPWLAARIVSDSADETLKPWTVALPVLMEQKRWLAVFGQLASHPQDLPGLLRLAMRMRDLQRLLSQFTAELISNVVEF